MKTNIILFITIVVITAYATYLFDHTMNRPKIAEIPQEQTSDLSGKPVPSFSFTDENGQTHSINDFKNKIVLLNFWASWCPPCLKEFPYFIKAANEFPNDIVVIALSSDFEENEMVQFLTKMKKQYPKEFPTNNFIASHDKNFLISQNLFGAVKLPETIIIDKTGKMTEKIIGADWHYKQLKQKIEALK